MFDEYANNPNVRAFLDVLAYCEGANYNTLYGGGSFAGTAHPCRSIKAGPYTSTAAGRYQFLCATWRALQAQYSFADFSPYSQDLAAIALIAQNGGLNSLLNGDLHGTVNAVRNIWPSLPSGSQQTKSWSQITTYFQGSLTAQGAAPSEAANSPGSFFPDLSSDNNSEGSSDWIVEGSQEMGIGNIGILAAAFFGILILGRLLSR